MRLIKSKYLYGFQRRVDAPGHSPWESSQGAEWLCSEFETDHMGKIIACIEFPPHELPRCILYIDKQLSPDKDDVRSRNHLLEDTVLAQIVVHEWDKLSSGDSIHLPPDVYENLSSLPGKIWKNTYDKTKFRYFIKKQWEWEKK